MDTAGDDGTRSGATRKSRVCQICGRDERASLHPGVLVRPEVGALIRESTGNWSEDGWICDDDLRKYRHAHIRSLLETEKGELSDLDREVIESMEKQEIVSRNPDEGPDVPLRFGQRLADRIAAVGGSWKFIISFLIALVAWIGVNSWFLLTHPFDPYPYILLNLVLSCLAAIQAPVIMMSQNRQEQRDRLQAKRDYQVNLKAELEIRHLQQKLDHFLSHQWERLIEIQELRMDDLNDRKDPGNDAPPR